MNNYYRSQSTAASAHRRNTVHALNDRSTRSWNFITSRREFVLAKLNTNRNNRNNNNTNNRNPYRVRSIDSVETSTKKNEQSEREPDVVILETHNKRIIYSSTAEVSMREYENLCEKVGWPKRDFARTKRALENSFLVSTMFVEDIDMSDNMSDSDSKRKKRKLIACARATSDHAFNACLWDVLVLPDYQGNGLGKALVSYSIKTLLKRDVANVTLFADKDVVEFYERLGFVSDADGVKGMFLYPHSTDDADE